MNIIQIKSFEEVDWSQFGENHLIAFDLDDTLFVQKTKSMRNFNVKYRTELINKIREKLGEPGVRRVYDQDEYQLTEQCLSEKIELLNNSKIQVIGFTARRTGLPPMATQTIEQRTVDIVKNIGVQFKPTIIADCVLPDTNSNILSNMILESHLKPFNTPNNENSSALILDGVTFSNNLLKGFILEKIFKLYNFFPTVFVMFDDKMYNHESIMKEIELINKNCGTNIEYLGFLYTGATDLYDNHIDQTKMSEQIDYFIETGRIVDF